MHRCFFGVRKRTAYHFCRTMMRPCKVRSRRFIDTRLRRHIRRYRVNIRTFFGLGFLRFKRNYNAPAETLCFDCKRFSG